MFRITILLVLLQINSAYADLHWQPVPTAPDSHHKRGAKTLLLTDLDETQPVEIVLIHSDLTRSDLSHDSATIQLKPTGKNSYHALFAQQYSEGLEVSAIRYIYLNGRPVDASPQELLNETTSRLQIIPAPLPREHWKYESRNSYFFKILFDGNPLASHPILASTSFGSSQIMHTNEDGIVTLTIPEDFPKIIVQRNATPPGELRLFTSIEADGTRHETSLSAPYSVSPQNWKSASLGFLFIGFGALTGLLLIRKLPAYNRRKRS